MENNKENVLYRIGMFAAMNRVTVKTLRFYEEQGLLMPAYINKENGYRYYTLGQMEVVHQISALKQAGFTLEDIAKINAGSDEESIIIRKKSELMEKIAELSHQISMLDGYLSRKKGSLMSPVLVKTIPETTVAYMTQQMDSYDCLFNLMPEMGALMESAECQCSLPEYCFTNYPEPGFNGQETTVETCEAVVEPKEGLEGLRFKVMPKIKAACIFHKGSYKDITGSYEILLKYIEENNLEIAGPIRESYIDGVWNKEDESQWLTELQIPVN